MVEKIIVTPALVRGYGNIMMVKDSTDFEEYNCSLTESTDTINGVLQTVFVEAYASPSVTVSISASESSIFVGGTVTLSATVLDEGVAVEGVSVNFKQGTTSIGSGTTNASGVATYTFTGTVAGSFTFSASYGSVSSTSVSVTVSEVAVSSVSLSASESSIGVGESVLLTASVSWNDGEPYSGETVAFYDGNTSLGTGLTDVNGVATLTASSLAVGSHTLTASIDGVTSSAVSVTVGKLSTSTSLTSSGNNVLVGTSVTLTATVTHSGSGVSGLTVTFYDGNTSLGTGTTNSSGVATLVTSALTVATHSLTAVVSESDTYAGSTSSAVSVVVYDHSYSLSFSQASYPVSSGSATVELTLLDNGVAVSGATITLSDGASSYSCITNQSGVASYTFSNVVSDLSITASYSNVSDTCTVTVAPTYLFYDACDSATGLSNYGEIRPISSSTTTSALEYNSSNNAYYVHANGDWGIIPIIALNGLDNYKITAEFKTKASGNTYQGGLGFIAETGTNNIIFRKYGTSCNSRINDDTTVQSIGTVRTSSSYWHKFEIVKQGRTLTVTVTDLDNDTVVGTQTKTITFDTYYVGFMTVAGTNYGSYVRNVKAESL